MANQLYFTASDATTSMHGYFLESMLVWCWYPHGKNQSVNQSAGDTKLVVTKRIRLSGLMVPILPQMAQNKGSSHTSGGSLEGGRHLEWEHC